LLGKTKDDATSVLRQAGYQVEFGDPVPHASIEKDAVVRQVPAAAEPAKSGSAVVLHLSSGPEQVSVPSLTGLNVASAKQKLEELGLKLGNVRWVYDEDLYPNAIVSQDPRPNAKLGAGTGVDIAVNRE
jgi:serine/threonine-protein kinase